MAEQICPACGYHIAGTGHETDGVVYCCEPCATSSPCECGCCTPIDEPAEKE